MGFLIFYIPIIASAILLLRARRDDLSARQTLVLSGAWLVASYLQFFGRSLLAWVLGLVAHVILAIYLSVRWKLM